RRGKCPCIAACRDCRYAAAGGYPAVLSPRTMDTAHDAADGGQYGSHTGDRLGRMERSDSGTGKAAGTGAVFARAGAGRGGAGRLVLRVRGPLSGSALGKGPLTRPKTVDLS